MDEPQLTIVELDRPPLQPRVYRRFTFLALGLITVIGLATARSFYLQVIRGSEFRAQAEDNRVATLPLAAPRGMIYDQFGASLVENIASTDIAFDPALLPRREDEKLLFDTLPSLIPISPDDIREALELTRTTQRIVVLARALNHDRVIAIEESLDILPGIRLISSHVRRYPYTYAASHVVGYTGSVSPEDLVEDSALLFTDTVGKVAIEKQYDEQLRGHHGVTLQEVDAAQRPKRIVGEQLPVAGSDLTLTLDIQLQEFIFNVLAERDVLPVHAADSTAFSGAAVVVLDPRNGAVRALVSYPGFDPNIFSLPSQQEHAVAVLHQKRNPLFNRVIRGMYPPGSTVKPLLAAAALQEDIITPTTTIVSNGGIGIGPWFFPDWKRNGHGVTDLTKAIAESVNTFFYLVTGGDETRRGLGAHTTLAYLSQFGWGSPTGIDLPSEEAGFLPSPEWKQETKGEPWYIGDTYHLGIGQGDLLITPLQLAQATASLANRGTLFAPYIVAETTSPDSHVAVMTPRSRSLRIGGEYLEAVRQGMRAAVFTGSAQRLAHLSIALAGKTGTAQSGSSDDTHAWFTSFGPYDSPELVVTVLLEHGGAGDRDAVPVAQEIWQWWIEHRFQPD